MRRQAFLALTLTFLATPALAQQTCAPPLKPMLRAELYFGLAVAGRAAVTRREWDGFVGRELTPRFPGLTVLDGRGAWRNGGRDVRERTKVVVIVTEESAATRKAIAEAAVAYKQRFHQQSVGIVTQPVCAAF